MTDFNLVPGQGLPTDSIERIEGKTVRDVKEWSWHRSFEVPGQDHLGNVFFGPDPSDGPRPLWTATAQFVVTGSNKRVTFHEPALTWDDLVDPLVEKAIAAVRGDFAREHRTPADPELARLLERFSKADEARNAAAEAAEGTPADSPERKLLKQREAERDAAWDATDRYGL
ncbi:MAG: hypothetical protein ABSA91_07700 [Acidimicrobiales bacterium]